MKEKVVEQSISELTELAKLVLSKLPFFNITQIDFSVCWQEVTWMIMEIF